MYCVVGLLGYLFFTCDTCACTCTHVPGVVACDTWSIIVWWGCLAVCHVHVIPGVIHVIPRVFHVIYTYIELSM